MSLFRNTLTHICTAPDVLDFDDVLPPLPKNATVCQKLKRTFLKSKLLWTYNYRSVELYRTEHELLKKQTEHLATYQNIIHPFSKFRSFYELFMALVWLILIIAIPLDCAFYGALYELERYEPDSSTDRRSIQTVYAMDYVEACLVIVCLMNMVVTFFTGYLEAKEVILEPKKIAKHYLKSVFFYCDLISSIPIVKIVAPYGSWVDQIDLLRLFRIVRAYTMIVYLQRTAELFHVKRLVYKVVIYILMFVCTMHWCICMLFLTPQLRLVYHDGQIDERSFVVRFQKQHSSVEFQYTFALYGAVGSFFCINLFTSDTDLGNILPWEENIMLIFLYIGGKIFLGILTVIMMQMFMTSNNLETKYYEIISQVQSYMKRKKLPMDMQKRMLNYYDYKYDRRFFKEETISGLLSELLRKEIKFHVCKKLVNTVSFFAELPITVLEDILIEMQEEIFLPNDIIMRYGANGDAMYFLASGTVSVLTGTGKEVCQLHDGAYFGEVSLVLKQKQRKSTIVAVEVCELYRLDKKAFRKCLNKHPDLLDKLEAIAKIREELAAFMETDLRE